MTNECEKEIECRALIIVKTEADGSVKVRATNDGNNDLLFVGIGALLANLEAEYGCSHKKILECIELGYLTHKLQQKEVTK